MGLEEALDEPGFWILGGGGIAMVILGWTISKKTMEFALPIWQMIILMVGILVAAAYFSMRD